MGRKKMSDAAKIRNYFTKHPNAKPAECIAALGVKASSVYLERAKMKKANLTKVSEEPKVEAKPTNKAITLDQLLKDWEAEDQEHDPVNNPMHYKVGGIETIDFIEAKELNYRLGNAVKYIARASHKGNYLEDLKKAVWYLEREIERTA